MPRKFRTKRKFRPRRRFHRKHRRHAGGPSKITFKSSSKLHQPMPDRFFTTVQIQNRFQISVAAGSNTGNFGFIINACQNPFNLKGGATSLLPNPQIALNAQSPAGFDNLLDSVANNNSGIYTYCRVHGVKVMVTFAPVAASGGEIHLSMAPVIGGGRYGNQLTMAAGPNAVTKFMNYGASGRDCTLSKYWSLPRVLGISKREYSAYTSNTYFSDGTQPSVPVYCQLAYNTADNGVVPNPVGFTIKVKYYIEYFQRADIGLLDT